MPRRPPPPDYERLAAHLGALAYPLRLELLDALRFPKALGEIHVSPHRVEPGGNADRPAAKPTVLGHLEKLVETGLVRAEQRASGGRNVKEYAINPQRLYAIVEELRLLSLLHAGYGVGDDATGTLSKDGPAPEPTGPRLVLVHGVYEGKAYRLDASTAREGGWTIGRADALPVALDYDPYVSLEHARVTRASDGYRIGDLPTSKNGTSVNWRPLLRGGDRRLRTGDLIGVGRSRLLFLET